MVILPVGQAFRNMSLRGPKLFGPPYPLNAVLTTRIYGFYGSDVVFDSPTTCGLGTVIFYNKICNQFWFYLTSYLLFFLFSTFFFISAISGFCEIIIIKPQETFLKRGVSCVFSHFDLKMYSLTCHGSTKERIL